MTRIIIICLAIFALASSVSAQVFIYKQKIGQGYFITSDKLQNGIVGSSNDLEVEYVDSYQEGFFKKTTYYKFTPVLGNKDFFFVTKVAPYGDQIRGSRNLFANGVAANKWHRGVEVVHALDSIGEEINATDLLSKLRSPETANSGTLSLLGENNETATQSLVNITNELANNSSSLANNTANNVELVPVTAESQKANFLIDVLGYLFKHPNHQSLADYSNTYNG